MPSEESLGLQIPPLLPTILTRYTTLEKKNWKQIDGFKVETQLVKIGCNTATLPIHGLTTNCNKKNHEVKLESHN